MMLQTMKGSNCLFFKDENADLDVSGTGVSEKPEPAVSPSELLSFRARQWIDLIKSSQHKLYWTQRRFVCLTCMIGRGAYNLKRWFQSGTCPGPPSARAAPMSRFEVNDEEPRTWTNSSTRRVVDEVAPLLSELQDVLKRGLAEECVALESSAASGSPGSSQLARSCTGHPSHDVVTRGKFSKMIRAAAPR